MSSESGQSLNQTAWDISSEFSGLAEGDFLAALKDIDEQLNEFAKGCRELIALDSESEGCFAKKAAKVAALRGESFILLSDIRQFVDCILAVDGAHPEGRRLQPQVDGLFGRWEEVSSQFFHKILTLPSETFEEFLEQPEVKVDEFRIRHEKKTRGGILLTLEEEALLASLSVDGHGAWGRMYTALSSTIRCKVQTGEEEKELGLAEAAPLLQSDCAEVRHAAWKGIHSSWETHREPVASALNSIAGWRLQVVNRRSHSRQVSFLEQSLATNRIEHETVEAMMEGLRAAREKSRQALRLQAKALSVEALHSADLLAPPPGEKDVDLLTLDQAMDTVIRAGTDVHSDFGKFLGMMHKKNWIEARILPTKRTGAFCCSFLRSRTPRIFLTFSGGQHDVRTLAHELGHAHHNWILRDLPVEQSRYPMTLAETASNFGEMTITDFIHSTGSEVERFSSGWQVMTDLGAYMLNIPVRFEFELRLYEQRSAGKYLTAEDLCLLMSDVWREWYGDAAADSAPYFWAFKLHYYLTRTPFYNYPYAVGYLLAHRTFGRRSELPGDAFYDWYRNFLLDTGRMTVEDVVKKHFDEDPTQPEFWNAAIERAKGQIDAFETLAENAGSHG